MNKNLKLLLLFQVAPISSEIFFKKYILHVPEWFISLHMFCVFKKQRETENKVGILILLALNMLNTCKQ